MLGTSTIISALVSPHVGNADDPSYAVGVLLDVVVVFLGAIWLLNMSVLI